MRTRHSRPRDLVGPALKRVILASEMTAEDIESATADLSDNGIGIPKNTHYKYQQGKRRLPRKAFNLYRKAIEAKLVRREGRAIAKHLLEHLEKLGAETTEALNHFVTVYNGRLEEESIFSHLQRISTVSEFVDYFSSFNRTRSNMLIIGFGLRRLDEGEVSRFADILCRAVEERWSDGLENIEIASIILERLRAFPLHQERRYRRLLDKLEKAIASCAPKSLRIMEPICMSAMQQLRPGPFVSHVTRLILDQSWRLADSKERRLYYGTTEAMIESILRHIRERDCRVWSHDIGCVVGLADQGHLTPDARFELAGAIDASLEEIQVRPNLRSTLRDRLLLSNAPGRIH
jgi:hypothetical protein